jgi:hypothetical protein
MTVHSRTNLGTAVTGTLPTLLSIIMGVCACEHVCVSMYSRVGMCVRLSVRVSAHVCTSVCICYVCVYLLCLCRIGLTFPSITCFAPCFGISSHGPGASLYTIERVEDFFITTLQVCKAWSLANFYYRHRTPILTSSQHALGPMSYKPVSPVAIEPWTSMRWCDGALYQSCIPYGALHSNDLATRVAGGGNNSVACDVARKLSPLVGGAGVSLTLNKDFPIVCCSRYRALLLYWCWSTCL